MFTAKVVEGQVGWCRRNFGNFGSCSNTGSDDDGHIDQIVAVSWSECGTWLASAGLDKRVIVWDAASGAPLAKVRNGASHEDRALNLSTYNG